MNNTLEYLIKERGINTHQLHKHTGIPLSTLRRLRLNKEHNPTIASLLPIAKYFKVTVDQLIGSNSLEIKTSSSNEITIPIVYWKYALHCKKDRYKQAFSFLLINDTSLSKDSYALIIEGHQWSNFLAGSLLIVDPDLDPNNRDFIVVHDKEQNLPRLHQVLIFQNKRYLKASDYNTEIVLFTDRYKNLGLVTQIRMNYKNNRQHVNFKDKKSSYSAKEY